MRLLGMTLAALLTASTAVGQYGLYGAPEMIPAAQSGASAVYPSTDTAPYAPAAQPTYVSPMGTDARTTYQPPALYRYPAQSPATASYQPSQPGAQYRYPAPANIQTAQSQATWRPPIAQSAAALQIPAPPSAPAYPYPAYGAPAPPLAPALPANNFPSYAGEVSSAPGAGVTNQMLAEQPTSGAAAGCGAAGCGPALDCDACCPCPWYVGVSALVVGRSDARRLWTSYVDGHEVDQLTNTQFGLEWRWGGEVRFGRRFCCGCTPYALEATYWTADPFSGSVSTSVEGGYVSTPLALNELYFGGVAAQNWFDGAREHRLYRQDEFHNVEINLVREQLAWSCDSPWDIGWSLGVRYFRFQDYLEFGTLAHSGSGWDDYAHTAYLSDNIVNNLIGAQFGFDAAYRLCDSVRVFIAPKVGLYGNYMTSDFEAYTGSGIQGHGPYAYFPVNTNRTGLSFLTQIDLGVDWRFAANWSARAGYRVVAITGVGLAEDQFPQYICDTPEIEAVSHYSSLVLHGAFVGLTYNF